MNKRPSYVCGVCSLLVIFSLICLTVFALVSLNTAKAGERLSRHQAKAISDYYDADLFAHSILAKIRGGQLPEGVEKDGDVFTYRCKINEKNDLYVKVKVSQYDYDILCWQRVASSAWQADDRLPVWDGN